MGIELVSEAAHDQRPEHFLWRLLDLVRSLICVFRSLWIRLTAYGPGRVESFSGPLPVVDCEKGLDVYQTRAQLLDALKRRDAADEAFEAQVSALLAPVKQRLAEITRDSGVLRQGTLDPEFAPDLPPVPQIFHGRTRELAVLVNMFVSPRQARVALVGQAAGVGVSALAHALLHRPEIKWTFGARRFLLHSDALAASLGLDPHTPRSTVLAALAACPNRTLIVLDDPQDDTLLPALTQMPRVSLLLTMCPPMELFCSGGYTTLSVGPLMLPDARALFRAIADLPAGTYDEYSDALLVDVSVPPATPTPTLLGPPPLKIASPAGPDTNPDACIVDALLQHARYLPRGIVHLAQRAQYEPLPFLLASCVEEGGRGV